MLDKDTLDMSLELLNSPSYCNTGFTFRGVTYNKCSSWAYVGSWGSSHFNDFDMLWGSSKKHHSQNFRSIGQSVAEIWLF